MLQIEKLDKTYANGVHALNGVTLSIDRGLFGLLGPNGGGKSSLMRTLATLQEPDSGTITFDGIDVLRDPQQHRRSLGYLPQDFGVYPGINAVDLLDHLALLKGLTNKAQRREQIDALLQQTNLYQHRRKAVSGYSGGMRQRFGIAQALLGDPRLLIVDEPTAGLDPEERSRFHYLLSEVSENVVIILSTHIVEDVRQLCPRMAVLSAGRIEREGEPDVLCAELNGRVWRRTVSRDAIPTIRQSHAVLSEQLRAGHTMVRVLADARPDAQFDAVEPELEDVYFAALTQARAA